MLNFLIVIFFIAIVFKIFRKFIVIYYSLDLIGFDILYILYEKFRVWFS